MPHELVLQAEVLGISIAFTVPAEGDEARLNRAIDMHANAINRFRATQELRFHYVDYLAALKAEKDFPKSKAEYIKKRTEMRTRERASWAAAFNASKPNARIEFSETAQHRQKLAQFDDETNAKLAEMDQAAADLPDKIAGLKAAIDRLQRRVKGESELVALEEEAAELERPLAAE